MDVVELVRLVQEVDVGAAEVPALRDLLADVGRVQSWLDGLKIGVRRRLEDLASGSPSMSPDHEIAHGSKSSLRVAERVGERAMLLDSVPALEDKLHAGEVSAEHVDVFARGAKQLDRADRDVLFDRHGARLAAVAVGVSPEEFTKAVTAAVNEVRVDGGTCRLERQRRATALRSWVDRDTGMVNIRGQFDPENGLTLLGRLHNTVQTLFADSVPDSCPQDPERKQDHLR